MAAGVPKDNPERNGGDECADECQRVEAEVFVQQIKDQARQPTVSDERHAEVCKGGVFSSGDGSVLDYVFAGGEVKPNIGVRSGP